MIYKNIVLSQPGFHPSLSIPALVSDREWMGLNYALYCAGKWGQKRYRSTRPNFTTAPTFPFQKLSSRFEQGRWYCLQKVKGPVSHIASICRQDTGISAPRGTRGLRSQCLPSSWSSQRAFAKKASTSLSADFPFKTWTVRAIFELRSLCSQYRPCHRLARSSLRNSEG